MTAESVSRVRPVVVGVDGSESALQAARWGAAEAVRHKTALRLVIAFAWPPDQVVGNPKISERCRDELMARSQRQLTEAITVAEQAAPELAVSGEVVVGSPIGVLGEQARRARLLVLGSRGLGGLAGLLLGSVAVGIAAHAACPAVVVRGEDREAAGQPVVVGVDRSSRSEGAIAFAYEAAVARGVPLVAVHAWSDVFFDPEVASLIDGNAVAENEETALAERLAGWAEKYPDVPVTRTVARDRAAHALVEHSKEAQLVVVGSRGRSNFTGLLLGSVSHGVLHRSHCPVAVVRPDSPMSEPGEALASRT